MEEAQVATLLTLLRVLRTQKTDALVVSHIRSLDSLRDDRMRQARLLEWLDPLPDEVVLEVLDRMLEGAQKDSPRFRAVLNSFAGFDPVFAAVGDPRLRLWRKIAQRERYLAILALLTSSPPRRAYYAPHQVDVNEAMEATPLGRRKSLARSRNRQVLDRLLFDRHPGVVRILLNNSRVVERDVVKLCAMQPTKVDTLMEVFRHPRWIRRYAVKKALVFNPYSPISVAAGLLGYLLEADLRLVTRCRRLSQEVREQAHKLLLQRISRRRRTLSELGPPPVEEVEVRPLRLRSEEMLAREFLATLPEAEQLFEEFPGVAEVAPEADEVAETFLAELPESLPLVPVGEAEPDE